MIRQIAIVLLALVLVGGQAGGQQARVVPDDRQQITLSFAPIVAKAAPAVVNIYSKTHVAARAPFSPLFQDPFFRRFFGDELGLGPPVEQEQTSLGSGVIVDPDGLVVTNHHVIGRADEITVVLPDRREFAAKLVRDDERTDLAVLEIDTGGERLPFLELGNSDALQVGDLVLAIGNPFGVGQTVTSGIVSGLARTSVGIADYNFFVQTDAAINPGNSGGALVTMDGRLAGVNTAIFSQSGGSQGIGFAVPSNMVRTVAASVGVAGGLRRPWLGAKAQTVTAELAAALDLPRPTGVVINDVYPGGAADRAGLQPGDIIVAVDGHEIADEAGLHFRMATGSLGDAAGMTVLRQGKAIDSRVTLEPAPEEPPRDQADIAGRNPLSGVTVLNLSPAVAEELGLDPFRKGVLVVAVARQSQAARVGVQPGDILLQVNDEDIDSVATLRDLVAARSGRWRISVRRGDRVLSATVAG